MGSARLQTHGKNDAPAQFNYASAFTRMRLLSWNERLLPGTELLTGRNQEMIFRFESDAGIHGRQSWSAELATVRDAQIQAIQTLGQLLSEDGSQFWVEEEVSMTVSDEGGLILFRLDLGAVRSAAFQRPPA